MGFLDFKTYTVPWLRYYNNGQYGTLILILLEQYLLDMAILT